MSWLGEDIDEAEDEDVVPETCPACLLPEDECVCGEPEEEEETEEEE